MVKLIRLRSVANNAVDTTYYFPFEHIRPRETIIVDLISGELTPDMKGDSVEEYFKKRSQLFHQVLEKEGIPLELIESAKITVTPEHMQCIIIADGKTFESHKIFF